MKFKKIVLDCITENDGASVCPIRVAGWMLLLPAVLIFNVAAALMLYKNSTLDLQQYGVALITMTSAVTAIFSLAVAVKAITDKPLPPT